ncbi:hypothetical protein K1719_004659 [Acacia pycnantha]|nr:hypothetical protein K1719_004659 [Acacia pycnantha]
MEIKVISREMVKPSKPTSPENKIFKLCVFDILQRNTYFPVILFYPTSTNPNNSLKQSLSETLTIFNPLAGRRKDLVSVGCNDEGALYYEATVNTTISDFLSQPKLESLNQLLPCEPNKILPPGESPSLPHLMVQVNTFECGGAAIGVCSLHTIMDGNSCAVFLRTWSAICRDQRGDTALPDFNSAFTLFPPIDFSRLRGGIGTSSRKGIEASCTIRRFVFNEECMNNLRTLAKDEDDNNGASKKPTRYQVLSSFIAKHMILAYSTKGITSNLVLLLHIIDIRRRRGEPLTSNSMGNLVWPAMIPYEKEDTNNNNISINDFVKITRAKIKSIDKDLFLRIERDPDFLFSDECGGMLMEGMEKKKPISLLFSSWCNLGFNDLDFGWGKPSWVGYKGGTQETVPNSVIFIDTSQGLEAWITMTEEFLAVLEKDEDFLTYASNNPSVSC